MKPDSYEKHKEKIVAEAYAALTLTATDYFLYEEQEPRNKQVYATEWTLKGIYSETAGIRIRMSSSVEGNEETPVSLNIWITKEKLVQRMSIDLALFGT